MRKYLLPARLLRKIQSACIYFNNSRLTLFILLLSTVLLHAGHTQAQSTRVSINKQNVPLKEVFQEIEKQTNYLFISNQRVDQDRAVSVEADNEPVSEILDRIFKNSGDTYSLEGVNIVITQRRSTSDQPKLTIKGTILDVSGEPIIGASVIEAGNPANGTISDIDGLFSLLVDEGAYIDISYIGYTSQNISVAGQTTFEIILEEDTKLLDEVVVVGYGVQKKVNLTGSITNVKSEELTKIPVSNLSNTLAGRAPGATIVGTSGLIGASSAIRIRGAFNEPLYIIDGFASNKASFDALDPAEVDQMSFLKDAATASVYGSSAGNGVVLVTTKKGNKTASKPKFTYQGIYSFSNPTTTLMTNQFTATDELIYQNRVDEFNNTPLRNGDAEFEYFKNRDYNVMDWIWQSPWNTKHTITVDGGNENIQYYMLGNFVREEGSFKNLANNKYNIRSNVTAKLSDYINLNFNISGSMTDGQKFYWPAGYSDNDFDVHDLYRSTFNVPRTKPFYVREDGTPAETGEITPYPLVPDYGGWTGWNAVDQVIGDRYVKSRKRELNAILTLNVDLGFITKGLSTQIMGGYKSRDQMNKRFLTFQKNYDFQMAEPNGNRFIPGPINKDKVVVYTFNQTDEFLSYYTWILWNEQFNWSLNYANSFGKNDLSAMIVFEQAANGGERTEATAKDPLTQYDQWFVYSTDALKRNASAGEYTGGKLSWIGRFNYIFDQRYILELNFRYDGNDNFAKDKRWGFFPSLSGAWRINQESFMYKTQDWLSDLKLRLSYGTTGNAFDVYNNAISRFSYIDRYVAGDGYIFGNTLHKGIKQGAIPNPDVTWATSQTYNAGIDYGFLNNRLSGTVDAFYKKETNILGARTIILPTTYGQSLAPENYAARSWKGMEFTINWADRLSNGFNYSTYFNLGYSVDQWDILDESSVYTAGNLQELSIIGMSQSRQLGYIAEGIIRTQEELDELLEAGFTQWGRDPYLGAIKYKDTRGDGYSSGADGKVDTNDWYNLLSENTSPRINYGFGGDFSYKGFSLALHFQGVAKYDRFIGGYEGGFTQHGGVHRPYYPIWASNDVWTTDNPNAKYPRVTGKTWSEAGAGVSTFWKRNGAYLRLKNLNLAYSIPSGLIKPIGLDGAQLFMNATNLFFISPVGEFHDPEQKNADSYPLMRTFTFGLNVSF